MKRFDRSWVVLVPILLAGCNGNDVSGGKSPPTGGLTEENSDDVGHAIVATVAGGGGASSGGGASEGGADAQALTSEEADACWSVSGDESDADGDEIPANALYTLTDCTWSEEGWSSVWNGTEALSDSDPAEADYDYAYAYDLSAAHTDGAGNTQTDVYTGSVDYASAGDEFTYAEVMNATYAGAYEGDDYEGGYAHDLVWVWTVTSEDYSTGTETVDGSWSESFDGESVSVTIETTDALVFDFNVCESGVIAGTLVASSGDATETITWTGCDEYTLSYDGS